MALLKDPDVRRWYDAVASRALSTADVRLRDLGAFCLRTETEPKALVSKPYLANRQKKLHDLVLDFIKAETERGISGPTTANRIDALKSWLDHNGVQLAHRIRIAGNMGSREVRIGGSGGTRTIVTLHTERESPRDSIPANLPRPCG